MKKYGIQVLSISLDHWGFQVPSILPLRTFFFSSYMYPLGLILGPTLFILHINDLPNDIYTLYSASDLWQKLELASELESDL